MSDAADAYLAHGYFGVRGMSSRIAAEVAVAIMRAQAAAGIGGGVFEIGAFEGRFLIGLALAWRPGERAVGVDTFHWPGPQVKDALLGNLARHGLNSDRVDVIGADSATLEAAEIRARLNGSARIAHVDGDHTHKALSADLALTASLMAERGVIILDDMLHPLYPRLAETVTAFLEENTDWRVVCVVDRETLSAAPKFVLCRRTDVAFYEEALRAAFPDRVVVMGADFVDYFALVISPAPELPVFD
jgi:predicted O-methyltransferase YrrM